MTTTLLKLAIPFTTFLWLSCGSKDFKDEDSSYDFKIPENVSSWTITEDSLLKTGDSLVTGLTSPDSSESLEIGYFSDGALEVLRHTRTNGYSSYVHKSSKRNQWMNIDYELLNGEQIPIYNCVTDEKNTILPDEITCFWKGTQIGANTVNIEAIHPMADSVHLNVSDGTGKTIVHSFNILDDNRGLFQYSINFNKEDTLVGFFRFFKPVTHEDKLEWSKASYAVQTTFFKYPNDNVFDFVENPDGSFSLIRKGIYAD
ncbi:MAG: hypothetical protein ACPGU4_11895 [Flavobacteriales bacterium]